MALSNHFEWTTETLDQIAVFLVENGMYASAQSVQGAAATLRREVKGEWPAKKPALRIIEEDYRGPKNKLHFLLGRPGSFYVTSTFCPISPVSVEVDIVHQQ